MHSAVAAAAARVLGNFLYTPMSKTKLLKRVNHAAILLADSASNFYVTGSNFSQRTILGALCFAYKLKKTGKLFCNKH